MAEHSNIVGGSSAKRVMACPGSVRLVQEAPPKPASSYAHEGTLLHNIMETLLTSNAKPEDFLGAQVETAVLTQELIDEKIAPALRALDEIDPDGALEYAVEQKVGFGDLLPGVFGSADLIGRLGDRGIVLDWKFGSGVAVEAEESPQGMFYTAAAMRTAATAWAFKDVREVEIIIVQPPQVKRWVTTPERIKQFEAELVLAVKRASQPDAPLASGDHCRWCAAKPTCPLLTGAVDRMLQARLKNVNADTIGELLSKANELEDWIDQLRGLAKVMLEHNTPVPGWKLVPKRATRQWVDEKKALTALTEAGLNERDVMVTELLSPAKVEKVLKKHKIDMPPDIVVAVSSGDTLAPEDDPRPAVSQIGKQLTAALGKLI